MHLLNRPDNLKTNVLNNKSTMENEWSILMLPDTQNLVESHEAVFQAQIDWINSQIKPRNIKAVLHMGDITDNNNADEWTVAQYLKNIDSIPMVYSIGNHDIGTNASNRTSLFNTYFDWTDFGPAANRGGYYSTDYYNTYHYFSTEDSDWMVLTLEFGPRAAVVTWAESIINANLNRNVIIITHSYLYHDDTRYDWTVKGASQSWSPFIYGISGDANDGQDLWDAFIKSYSNIRLVLCGHVLGDGIGYLVSAGDNGNNVVQMLANYQGGDDDTFRILTINETRQTMHVATFSPDDGVYTTDAANLFTSDIETVISDATHGVNNLLPTPTINGSPRTPIARYKCVDADATNLVAWDYGATLVRQAVGTEPTYNNGAPAGAYSWDSNTDSCLFNTSDYYQCADGTTGDIAGNDYFWELIAYTENSGTERMVDKRIASNEGYSILNSTDKIRILIEDAPNNTISVYSAATSTGWHHFCGYANVDESSTNGSIVYTDGVGGTGVDVSGIGSLTNTNSLTIGATATGAAYYHRGIIYFCVWTAADMIAAGAGGKTEMDALALARSNAFWGV